MSKIASIFLFVLMAGPALGQQEHFALIRTDNDQPFYVHIRQQTLSSSAQGHLILSQLHDSLYPIAVGFPRQQFPEQEFTLKIDGKDLDLQLIYRQEKGWVLVDRITQEEQLPGNDPTKKKTHLEGIKKDDAFSRLMADVVSDTSVMYNTYAEEASRDSAARIADSLAARKAADSLAAGKAVSQMTASPPPPTHDSAATRKTPAPDSMASHPVLKAAVFTGSLDPIRADSSIRHTDSGNIVQKAPPPAKPAPIEKIAEQQTAMGLRISYIDRRKGQRTDTIDIQIPVDSIPVDSIHIDSIRKNGQPDTAR